MRSGIEVDTEIARKLFRCVVVFDENGHPSILDRSSMENMEIPPYSQDTRTSYEVVNKLKSVGCAFEVKSDVEDGDLVWSVSLRHPQLSKLILRSNSNVLAKAICTVALQFLQLFQIQE